jgi:hypothetical protein
MPQTILTNMHARQEGAKRSGFFSVIRKSSEFTKQDDIYELVLTCNIQHSRTRVEGGRNPNKILVTFQIPQVSF